jgi:hypothetical protein
LGLSCDKGRDFANAVKHYSAQLELQKASGDDEGVAQALHSLSESYRRYTSYHSA